MSLIRATPTNLYMIAPSLQQGFIDKDSGELLVFGYVNFFRDDDHSTRKPVYSVSGPPDSPVFTELPNPLFLSSIGTFLDPNNNQDIIPWYHPFDENGNVDLYYIEVYSAGNVLQVTRDHYPSINSGGSDLVTTEINLIPNGQFLLHLDLPNNGIVPQSDRLVDIAFGGWGYVQTMNTTSNNTVTFERYNAPILFPDQNPRYSVRIQCTNPDPADDRKDILDFITDVNFLQGQAATVGITAYSNDGNNHNVEVIVGKYFGSGTGGSAYIEENIGTILITPEIQPFTIPFTMSSNIGQVLGPNNDDHLSIIFRSPLDTSSDIFYTDAIMLAGTFTTLSYVPTTPEQAKSFALAGSFDIPAYDGSDIGSLVQIGYSTQNQTLLGFTYTNNNNNPSLVQTGMHFAYIGTTAPNGYLLEDGSAYAVQGGSVLPMYPDLFEVIFQEVGGQPTIPGTYAFGTGINGFTWTASGSSGTVTWNRYDITQPAPISGTSGFTFTLSQSVIPNTQQQIYNVTFVAGSAITAGSYFILPVNTTGPVYNQLFWFMLDGVGTAPSVAFDVAVSINLSSTMTAAQIAEAVQIHANGLFQVPDVRALVIRYWNNGSVRNPNTIDRNRFNSQIAALASLDYTTGNHGDNIGSIYPDFQGWDFTTTTPPPVYDIYFNGIIKT